MVFRPCEQVKPDHAVGDREVETVHRPLIVLPAFCRRNEYLLQSYDVMVEDFSDFHPFLLLRG